MRALGVATALIGGWALAVWLIQPSPLLFPGPAAVAVALWEQCLAGILPRAVGASLLRMLVGYGLAIGLGLAVGLLGAWRPARGAVAGLCNAMQSIPSVCWLPLALLWFGLSDSAVVLVVVLGATWSIALAVLDGLSNTPPLLLKAARTLGCGHRRTILQVRLPAAWPAILTGLKLGWAFAWRSLMGAELLYSEQGLGRMMVYGRDLGDMPLVMAVMVVILAIGLTANRLGWEPLERVTRRRWGLAA